MAAGPPTDAWILILLAGPALAQDWQVGGYDDGSFFAASISPTGPGGFTLLCGGCSPQGLSAMQTGNTDRYHPA